MLYLNLYYQKLYLINASFSILLELSQAILKKLKLPLCYKQVQALQTSLDNYRPIFILSIFNKLLEKLKHKRILDLLEKKKVIYCKQFGFCAKHSTDHAILSIIDLIQHAIDCHKFSCGIFLDFSKAFDTVNHNILIEKLQIIMAFVEQQKIGSPHILPTDISLFSWDILCQIFNLRNACC